MTLALICGQGRMPGHLLRVLLARGEVPLVCEVAQFPAEVSADVPRLGLRLERFGTFLDDLRGRGITRLCMVGAMRRPVLDPVRIDAATVPLIPRLRAALARGDDGTLRGFMAMFEAAGITVLGAAELDPGLLPPPGGLCGPVPEAGGEDARAGQAALAALGREASGQAVVVRGGQVVAHEDDRGTDALLAGLAGPAPRAAAGGLLYKAPRPGQDLRADMPVIGPQTVLGAARAGLDGIVIAAGGVMVPDRAEVVRRAQAAGLFVWVRPGAAR